MKRILSSLLISVILSALAINTAAALSPEQKQVIDGNSRYFDVAVGCASDSDANGKIYVLGDSLTVGMRDQGELSGKLEANEWSTVTIQATNGDKISDALPKVIADEAVVSEASTVVIGLGTNREPAFGEKVTELVNKIKEFNNEVEIYWINIYTAPGSEIPGGAEENQRLNQIITRKANELGFRVLNWRGEAVANPDTYPYIVDGVHHTPEGYDARAAWVADEIGTPPASISGGSAVSGTADDQLPGDSNEEKIFNYLVGREVAGQELKDYHVAGILGNMWAESAFRPQRLQGTGVDDITPAESARNSSSGWGLVQWTPAGKMINPTLDAGKDANLISIQLDFLLEQLNGAGPSAEGAAGQALMAATDVGAATLAFETQYERHAGDPQPERIVKAQELLDAGFSGGGGGDDGCGGGAGSTDFSTTVSDYAWETYHEAPYLETKPAYADAIETAVADGQYVGGNGRPGIDCGGFITRLMIDSGFEPNFNYSGVIADGAANIPNGFTPWLEANWDKITVGGTQDLQPGDVAVNTGRTHAFVYVGDIEGGFENKIASASIGSGPDGSWRSPMAGTETLIADNIEWYRQR